MRKYVWIVFIFGLLVVAMIVVKNNPFKDIARLQKEAQTYKPKLSVPVNYLELFNSDVRPGLIQDYGIKFNYRKPVINFLYDSGIHILVYQIDFIKNSPVSGLAILDSFDNKRGTHYSYHPIPLDDFQLNFTANKMDLGDSLLVSFSNPAKIMIDNDSTSFFILKNSDVFIKYGKNRRVDIFTSDMESGVSSDEGMRSLLFLRRHEFVYMLLLYAENKINLKEELLYDLVRIKV